VALAGVERALGEIREVLGSLKPAEQLRVNDEAIRNSAPSSTRSLRANDDPSTVRQLENAIAALRSIVSNVASTTRWSGSATTCRHCRPRSISLPAPKAKAIAFAMPRAAHRRADLDAGKP